MTYFNVLVPRREDIETGEDVNCSSCSKTFRSGAMIRFRHDKVEEEQLLCSIGCLSDAMTKVGEMPL